jgi:hypothetical protein
MAFAEFCKEKGIEGDYVTITMINHDPNNRPLYNSIDYIAVNVHCQIMGCSRDLCINSAIKSYINTINILNNKYGLKINNLNETNNFLPDVTNTNINIDKFLKWHTSNSNKNSYLI